MNKTRELAIFEYVLIVQLNPSTGQPFIAYRYPPSTDQGAKDSISGPIMRFCFPELEQSDQSKKKDKKKKLLGGMGAQQSETFSFVLTDSDGSRKFGYCRRMRVPNPEKHNETIVECHCMLSLCTSFSLFRRILDIVEERRKASTKPKPTAVFSFLQSVLANKFPDPGETITVRTFAAGGGAGSSNGDVYQLTRSLGSRFEYLDYVSFVTLFKLMSIPKILELFGNMLLERRVIVAAKTLGILSSCVNALSALLYPFSWQHVFIPVLPQSLLDYCAAPMPFLLGILADSIPAVKKQPLEEVYIVDLDKGTFITNAGFPSVLPVHELRTLEMSLESIVASGKKGRAFDFDVAAAFLDFFQSILSGYAQFMRNHKLDVQAFRDAQPPAIKAFLDQFEASQMWFSFIMEREIMSEKGTLRNCVLLKAQSHAPPPESLEQPAVFEVCCKCGCDVEDNTQDKDGRPICMACLEAKERKGLGWFKSRRGDGADDGKGLKAKVGNVSKRFGKSKEKSNGDATPAPASAPVPTGNGSSHSHEKKETPATAPALVRAAPATSSAPTITLSPASSSSHTPTATTTPAYRSNLRKAESAPSAVAAGPPPRPVNNSASYRSPSPSPSPSLSPSTGGGNGGGNVSDMASRFGRSNTTTPSTGASGGGKSSFSARPHAATSTQISPRPAVSGGGAATTSPQAASRPAFGNQPSPAQQTGSPFSASSSAFVTRPTAPSGPGASSPAAALNQPGNRATMAAGSKPKPLPPTPGTQLQQAGVNTGARFCSGCGKPFGNGEQVLNALNGAWHDHCFTCERCRQPFKAMKFVQKDGKPYHPACVKEAFGRKCYLCSQVLEGQCVKVEDNVAHARCFVCVDCKAPLAGGYVLVGPGRACCHRCGQGKARFH